MYEIVRETVLWCVVVYFGEYWCTLVSTGVCW